MLWANCDIVEDFGTTTLIGNGNGLSVDQLMCNVHVDSVRLACRQADIFPIRRKQKSKYN